MEVDCIKLNSESLFPIMPRAEAQFEISIYIEKDSR